VINFDVPMVPEDYVHRIGRTARAQMTGDAITFVARDEEKLFTQIEKVLGKRIDRAKLPPLPEITPEQLRVARAEDLSDRRDPSHGRSRPGGGNRGPASGGRPFVHAKSAGPARREHRAKG